MFRRKTHALLLIAAISGSVALPAAAQVDFFLSTNKTYRQQEGTSGNWNSYSNFEGGNLRADLSDGSIVYVGGCVWDSYVPANSTIVCPGGSTAFITFGTLEAAQFNEQPYYWVTEIQPAIIVEPRFPQLCQLVAAPVSDLRRPLGGFVDDSFGIYYNLHTTEVQEYLISRYDFRRRYNADQRNAFEKQIVPGVYHYEFPRLDNPLLAARISPIVYPMPEGPKKINNQKSGVLFNTKGPWKGDKRYSNRWNRRGFYELSYIYPNTIRWSGFNPSEVYPAVDNLYISLRYLSKPSDPKSDVTYTSPTGRNPASIFPSFTDAGDPRVLLTNPFVQEFTLPPIFTSGTKGVIELELDRDLNTSAISRDLSTRRFRLPFMIVNYYKEFKDLFFGEGGKNQKQKRLLKDYDKDGFNNLTEWILETGPTDPDSFPDIFPFNHPEQAPARLNEKITEFLFGEFGFFFSDEAIAWYGYALEKQRKTVPAVKYILQRSTNGGKTWRRMREDDNWFVINNRTYIGFASKHYTQATVDTPPAPLIPPGTAGHQYRIKIVLDKKKKKKKSTKG